MASIQQVEYVVTGVIFPQNLKYFVQNELSYLASFIISPLAIIHQLYQVDPASSTYNIVVLKYYSLDSKNSPISFYIERLFTNLYFNPSSLNYHYTDI